MPQPKRRHTPRRRGNRRAHDALPVPALTICRNCQERIRPHVVCPHCGHYRGEKVIEADRGV